MALLCRTLVEDGVALAEIELCGDLMIAASDAGGERMTPARIDEVLKVDRVVRAASCGARRLPAARRAGSAVPQG